MELKKYGKYYVLSAGLSKKIGRNAAELLFYLSAWQGNNGYVFRTQKQIEEDIGLSPYQQRGARSKLIKLNLLREIRQSLPCRLYYKVNTEELEKYQVREEIKKAVGAENIEINKNSQISKNLTTRCEETSHLEKSVEANIDKPVESEKSLHNKDLNNNSKFTEGKSLVIKSVNLDDKHHKVNHIFQIYLIYCKYYSKRYNINPVFNKKIAGQIKYLWESVRDLNKIEKMIEAYLNASDAYICSKFHAFGLMLSEIQRWNVLSQDPEQSKILTEEYIRKRKYYENTEKAKRDIDFQKALERAYSEYGHKFTKEEIYRKVWGLYYGKNK